MSGGRGARGLSWGLFLVLASSLAAPRLTLAEPTEVFRRGLEAVDRGQWVVAAEQFRAAIAADGQESEKRIFVSGVFSYPYLPHFYLGWALHKAGLDNCAEALEELEISTEQRIVERFKRQLEDLQQAREVCNRELLPTAVAAAAQAIERASALAESIPKTLDEPALETERRQAGEDLEASRAAFAAAQTSGWAGNYRQAEELAETVTTRLTELERKLALSVVDERLEDALRSASTAIASAERAREELVDLLAEPRWALARQALPDITMPVDGLGLLRGAGEKVARREALAEIEEARREASLAEARFKATRERAVQSFSSWAEAQRQNAEPVAEVEEPAPAATALPPPAASSTTDSGGEAVASVLRRVAAARELLGQLEGIQGGELFTAQRSRLETLVSAAGRGSTGDLEGLSRRLAESTSALRLIAGVAAFLSASPERCVELLEGSAHGDPRFAAEAYLFLSAARFALYRLGGESDRELRRRSVEAARQSRVLGPSRSLDESVFSPAFRAFFAAALPNI